MPKTLRRPPMPASRWLVTLACLLPAAGCQKPANTTATGSPDSEPTKSAPGRALSREEVVAQRKDKTGFTEVTLKAVPEGQGLYTGTAVTPEGKRSITVSVKGERIVYEVDLPDKKTLSGTIEGDQHKVDTGSK